MRAFALSIGGLFPLNLQTVSTAIVFHIHVCDRWHCCLHFALLPLLLVHQGGLDLSWVIDMAGIGCIYRRCWRRVHAIFTLCSPSDFTKYQPCSSSHSVCIDK